jgi:hypothetical protein
MVLTLHIRHEGSHDYLARVFDGQETVGDFTRHERIDDAIAFYAVEAAHRYPGVTAFAIWYGGWTVGEVPLSEMLADAPQLASRLLVLSAVLR